MSGARIAVIRGLRGLGDMLCVIPAVQALRSAHPDAHITLIGLPGAEWLVRRFSDCLDGWLPFPGFPGIPERRYSGAGLAAFLQCVQSTPFDLAIQMHGDGTISNAFTALLGARRMAGLYRPEGHRPRPGAFLPYPEHGSEIHRWLRLMEGLGCSRGDDRLAFPLQPADRAALQAHPRLRELERGCYALVHPGARDPLRRWPPAHFGRVVDALGACGLRVVLTGSWKERPTVEAVARRAMRPALDVAGETSLGALAALLEGAALLVTNDTGISHLAAAVRTPSVVVFLASDPDRWAPLDRKRHRSVVARGLGQDALDDTCLSSHRIPDPEEVLEEAFPLLAMKTDTHERGLAHA